MVCWNVELMLRMKGVILGIERARVEAEDLISSDVGSSHDTTPDFVFGIFSIFKCMR